MRIFQSPAWKRRAVGWKMDWHTWAWARIHSVKLPNWQKQCTTVTGARNKYSSCLPLFVTNDLSSLLGARCLLAFLGGDYGIAINTQRMDEQVTGTILHAGMYTHTCTSTQLNGNDQREPGDNHKYLQMYQQAYSLTLEKENKTPQKTTENNFRTLISTCLYVQSLE